MWFNLKLRFDLKKKKLHPFMLEPWRNSAIGAPIMNIEWPNYIGFLSVGCFTNEIYITFCFGYWLFLFFFEKWLHFNLMTFSIVIISSLFAPSYSLVYKIWIAPKISHIDSTVHDYLLIHHTLLPLGMCEVPHILRHFHSIELYLSLWCKQVQNIFHFIGSNKYID